MEIDRTESDIRLENAYAVIIGIGKYQDTSIPELKYTKNDANELYEVLINPRKVGIQKEKIRLLLDEQATLQNIKSTVGTWLLREAGDDSTVVIFFSGHGGIESDLQGENAQYLLPWDARRDDLYATAISSRDFEGLLQRIKSNRLVMFLDACHSGGVISREGAKDVNVIDNICADLAVGSGRAIIAASQGNQQSFEDEKLGHGIFAYHLLDALNGKADSKQNGTITLTETFNYLGREVPKSARLLAGAVQEPMMRSELKKDIVLAVDYEKLDRIKEKKEQEEKTRKAEEDTNRLFQYWSDEQLETEDYDKALQVYGADYQDLDDNDRRIKKLTHDLLDGKISIKNYVLSLNKIHGRTAEPRPTEEIPEPEIVTKKEEEAVEPIPEIVEDFEAEVVDEETKAAREAAVSKARELFEESARKTQEAADVKAREMAAVFEKKEPVQPRSESVAVEKEVSVPAIPVRVLPEATNLIKRLTRNRWFWIGAVVVIAACIIVPKLFVKGPEAPGDYNLSLYTIGMGKVESFNDGTKVTLIPVPDSGWEFSKWTGDINTSEDRIGFIMDSDMSLTAVFQMVESTSTTTTTPSGTSYSVTTYVEEGGTIVLSPSKSSYSYGDRVAISAIADDGWEFYHWSGDVASDSRYQTTVYHSVIASMDVTAVFRKKTVTYVWRPLTPSPYPVFENTNMIKAACLAIDEDAISQYASNYYDKTIQLVPNNELGGGLYDVGQAKQLSMESGYPDGFKMTMYIKFGDEILAYIAGYVQDYLADIGFQAEIYAAPMPNGNEQFTIELVEN